MARMAAGKVPTATLQALRAQIASLRALPPNQPADRALARDVDEGLHGAISEAVENRQLSAIIRTMRRQTQIFDLRSMPERLADTCGEHLAILDAVEAGDPDRAASAMAAHLARVRDSIIQRLTRL